MTLTQLLLTETTQETQPSGVWSTLTAIGTALVAALGTWLITRATGRAPGHAEPTPHPVQVPTDGGGTSTRDLAGESPALVGAIEDMAETMAGMQRRLAAQAAQLNAERGYSDSLEDHIEDMIAGHAAGRYPPWRPRPPRT